MHQASVTLGCLLGSGLSRGRVPILGWRSSSVLVTFAHDGNFAAAYNRPATDYWGQSALVVRHLRSGAAYKPLLWSRQVVVSQAFVVV